MSTSAISNNNHDDRITNKLVDHSLAVNQFQLDHLINYLNQLLPLIISATPDQLTSSPIFTAPESLDRLYKFGTDQNCRAIYLSKTREQQLAPSNQVVTGTEQDATFTFVYTFKTEIDYTSTTVTTLAFIKRVPTLDCSRPLDHQLHFLNLFGPASNQLPIVTTTSSGTEINKDTNKESTTAATSTATASSNPYEELHNLVHLAVAPFFDAYVNSKNRSKNLSDGGTNQSITQAGNTTSGSSGPNPSTGANATSKSAGNKDSDTKMGIPMAKKKFAELELSLLHLQQNVEIPEITLIIHPIILNVIDRARREDPEAMRHGNNIHYMLELLDPSLLKDDKFLNKLQSLNVTNLSRDVESGTASQEINFWLSMEKALQGVEEQLRSEPISWFPYFSYSRHSPKLNTLLIPAALTLDILKTAKRYHTTVSFLADTGLKEASDNGNPYPIRRALPLAEAISKDLTESLLKVLTSHRLMYTEYTTFSKIMAATASVCQTWEEQIKDFTTIARELTRKRNEKFIPIKINASHLELKERCEYLKGFRKQHEQLRIMTGRDQGISKFDLGATGPTSERRGEGAQVSGLMDLDMEEEVRAAYESVKNVEVLDTSPDGTQIWSTAEAAYNERVSRVENQIISRLRARHQLETRRKCFAFSLNSTLCLYGRKSAEPYKNIKLSIVTRKRIQCLSYGTSPRLLEPLWARQIERQMLTYMGRVEDVLGVGWENYAEGSRLANDSSNFLKKLDTKPIFEQWVKDWNKRDMSITGPIFEIQRNRSTGIYTLIVAFNPEVIVIFKEVRNLSWLGYNVPYQLTSSAKDAKKVYPNAVSLMESIRTYAQTLAKVTDISGIADLVADYRNDLCQMIGRGLNMRWENFVGTMLDSAVSGGLANSRLGTVGGGDRDRDTAGGRQGTYVRDLANKVGIFQERTDDLLIMYETCSKSSMSLALVNTKLMCLLSCEQDTKDMKIDGLSVTGYVNLQEWTKEIDRKIEDVFLRRLENVIQVWNQHFDEKVKRATTAGQVENTTLNAKKSVMFNLANPPTTGSNEGMLRYVMESDFRVLPLAHEIRIRNQVIYLDPPIEAARANWYKQLHQWLGVICNLPRIQSQRYDLGLKLRIEDTVDNTYLSLMGKFSEAALQRPYALIESLATGAIRDSKTRSTFDNSESLQDFGVCVIHYEQVQAKVNAKYDMWQKDVLVRFGSKLGAVMRDTHTAITKSRHDLEHHSIETSSTAQAVTFITFVQDLNRKVKKWEPDIEIFGSADWLYVDQIEGGLQMKIVAEDKVVQSKIESLIADWEKEKPISGELKPDVAMNSINSFETRVNRLQDEHSQVCRAKEALDLEHTSNERLEPVAEEISDLKAVWTALSGIWAQLAELREMPWSSVTPRKLRQALDALLASTREMPSKMRQYQAFEFVQEKIRFHQKSVALVGELKSDALRERHWKLLYKNLRLPGHYAPSQMTLGTIWDMDLKKNESPSDRYWHRLLARLH
ncbi:dynein heavy chain, N-terminal region 1-domain-containing protein [Melampsora americana]|nr:dynein heavy chain, N-terminal region 1-domain-containing protein [Melampsora americana]